MEFSYYNEIRMVDLGFHFLLENIKYKVSIDYLVIFQIWLMKYTLKKKRFVILISSAINKTFLKKKRICRGLMENPRKKWNNLQKRLFCFYYYKRMYIFSQM